MDKIKIKGDDLKIKNMYGYSVGHIINDINCTLLFNYLLYFLTDIVHLTNAQAGTVSMVGQIFDALLSLVVGILVDKYEIPNMGKKTTWYVLGNVLNAVGIIAFFQMSPFKTNYEDPNSTLDFLYYVFILVVFSSGYSLTNISHISMLPSLSINRKSKDYMVRLRTGFRFLAQLFAVFLSSLMFYFIRDKFSSYIYLTIICTVIGLVFSATFLVLCRETILSKNVNSYYRRLRLMLRSKFSSNMIVTIVDEVKDQGIDNHHHTPRLSINQNLNTPEHHLLQNNENASICYWLTLPLFWKYLVSYIVIHISINFSLSLMPYFMTSILEVKQTEDGGTPVEIAMFFLISTIGSISSSLFIQQHLEKFNSRFVLYLSAWIFLFIGSVPMVFLTPEYIQVVYFLSFLIGIGYSLAINIANIIVNDVVGNKETKGGGFVYSAFGFSERVLNGFLILFCMTYVKDIYLLMKYCFPLIPIVLLFVGMLIVKFQEKHVTRVFEDDDEDYLIDEHTELLLGNPYFSFTSIHEEHGYKGPQAVDSGNQVTPQIDRNTQQSNPENETLHNKR